MRPILFFAFIAFCFVCVAQSPEKLYKNGLYERALKKAAQKQNKRVKIKGKYKSIILNSYKKLYEKQEQAILSSTSWGSSYGSLRKLYTYYNWVRHDGLKPKLKAPLSSAEVLNSLSKKFSEANNVDLINVDNYKKDGNYQAANEAYIRIKRRAQQGKSYTTLASQLQFVDIDTEHQEIKSKLGDKLISEAKVLIKTKSKQDARRAFKQINEARQLRTLAPQEVRLQEQAKNLGTTFYLIENASNNPICTALSLSGELNFEKGNNWISYLTSTRKGVTIDYKITITEKGPFVRMGKLQKNVVTQTNPVEYMEDVIEDGEVKKDKAGNPVQEKKTKNVTGVAAEFSQEKSARIDWSIIIVETASGKTRLFEDRNSSVYHTKTYASLISGDIKGLSENLQSKVELKSEPFPEDREMREQVQQKYLNELTSIVRNFSKGH